MTTIAAAVIAPIMFALIAVPSVAVAIDDGVFSWGDFAGVWAVSWFGGAFLTTLAIVVLSEIAEGQS